ncbi:Glucosamine kinase GspK [Planctomycetes bacterium MalM25]|nr:Glucosamine kinase GspK [Planctomycetes bacterium MalM25]
MTLVLGIDGGGTKTRARVLQGGSEGRLCLLGSGEASGSNPFSVGWEAAQEAIQTATRDAMRQSGQQAIDSAVLAVAGCASEAAGRRLQAWAEEHSLASRVMVVPDTEPVLAEVRPGDTAIGLIAGTGSAALLRRGDGSTEVIGGWGYLIDDGGSGYTLGRDALRHAASAADAANAPDALAKAVLLQAGVDRPEGLKQALYGDSDPRGWAARLARMVLGLAEQGDPAASAIAARGAQSLSVLVKLATERLDDHETPRLLLAGGLLGGSRYYRRRVSELLVADGWTPDRITLAPDAACGCGRLALKC